MGIKLKEAGEHNFLILERADELGGTWRDNHYPGAACDIPSVLYSFSFEPNPDWSRVYPTQPELLAYERRCAKKYGLIPHLRFGAEVTTCRYDDESSTWSVCTADGRTFDCSVLISGVGGLSNPAYPDIAGLESFQGTSFHSADWNHDVDLAGKRVAVIGSGASSIQMVPPIAATAAHLDYYQRTPAWVMPKADRPLTARERRRFTRVPLTRKLSRLRTFAMMEVQYLGFSAAPGLLRAAERLVKAGIRKAIPNLTTRDKVTPDYRAGCKRILISNEYYPALARPNVEVITEGITEVLPLSIVTADGVDRPIDVIIFGTGFKVHQMVPDGMITGAHGRDLAAVWRDNGTEAFKGTTVPGFPNLFLLVGPNVGLGHNSMILQIEAQVRYVMGALRTIKANKLASIDVRDDVVRSYNRKIQKKLAKTVWIRGGCRSWYLDASGKNTTLWPGFTLQFRRQLRSFDASDYVLTHLK